MLQIKQEVSTQGGTENCDINCTGELSDVMEKILTKQIQPLRDELALLRRQIHVSFQRIISLMISQSSQISTWTSAKPENLLNISSEKETALSEEIVIAHDKKSDDKIPFQQKDSGGICNWEQYNHPLKKSTRNITPRLSQTTSEPKLPKGTFKGGVTNKTRSVPRASLYISRLMPSVEIKDVEELVKKTIPRATVEKGNSKRPDIYLFIFYNQYGSGRYSKRP